MNTTHGKQSHLCPTLSMAVSLALLSPAALAQNAMVLEEILVTAERREASLTRRGKRGSGRPAKAGVQKRFRRLIQIDHGELTVEYRDGGGLLLKNPGGIH